MTERVNAKKRTSVVGFSAHLHASVDGGAPVLRDLRLDERHDVVDVGDTRVVRGSVGADARLARRDDELLARDSLREQGRRRVVVSGIVNEQGTGTRGANARARAISGRSDARVDVVVARDATRANAGSDGRRGTMKGVTRGCHDSVNVSGRTSGEAPWRAGKLLAIRRAATGGAARGLPAWTGTLMTMEGAVATDMADARAWGSGARPGVSWTFRREAVRNDEAARVSCVI